MKNLRRETIGILKELNLVRRYLTYCQNTYDHIEFPELLARRDALKTKLALLPHIPNKQEGKALRRAAAKKKR